MSVHKPHRPTEYRLQKLREEGTTYQSREFAQAAVQVSVILVLYIAGHVLVTHIESVFKTMFTVDMHIRDTETFLNTGSAAFRTLLMLSVVIGGVAFVGALAAGLSQNSRAITLRGVAPNVRRINPIARFKQSLCTPRFLRATALSLLKLLFVFSAVFVSLKLELLTLSLDNTPELSQNARLAGQLLCHALFAVGAVLFAFGCLDRVLQRRDFFADNGMSHEDLRREIRDQEITPEIKRHISDQHRSALRSATQGGLERIAKAAIILRNPTHLVVALEYDEGLDAPAGRAPRVVAKGTGKYGQQLLEEAGRWNVPIRRNIPLARSLFETPLDNEIPPELYQVVDIIMTDLAIDRAFELISQLPSSC